MSQFLPMALVSKRFKHLDDMRLIFGHAMSNGSCFVADESPLALPVSELSEPALSLPEAAAAMVFSQEKGRTWASSFLTLSWALEPDPEDQVLVMPVPPVFQLVMGGHVFVVAPSQEAAALLLPAADDLARMLRKQMGPADFDGFCERHRDGEHFGLLVNRQDIIRRFGFVSPEMSGGGGSGVLN